jgi:hypothetical protein
VGTYAIRMPPGCPWVGPSPLYEHILLIYKDFKNYILWIGEQVTDPSANEGAFDQKEERRSAKKSA